MKKLSRYIFAGSLATVLALGSAVIVRAQDEGPTDKQDQGKGNNHKGWGHFGGFKEKLGLTDEQAAKLKDLFKAQREETKPLRDHLRIDIDNLRLQVDSNASKSELAATLDKLSGEKKALRTAQEKFQQKLRGVLDPKQQAQMVLSMGGGRRGGFGRPGNGDWGKPGMDHSWGANGDKAKNDESKDSPAPDQN